jgi:aspartate aminotransferase
MKPPAISERGATAPASPIRKLVPLSVAARDRGVNVHGVNIGQPDLPTPQAMWDAVTGCSEKVLAYSPSEGIPELREALSRYYAGHRIDLPPDRILVTTGASEAVQFAVAAIADPGDEILIPEPLYANYIGFAHLLGVRVVPIATTPEDGYHLPPRAHWETRIGPRTRALLLCNPGNPTGTVYRPEELEMILDLAGTHGLFVLADEVYREFCYDGLEHRSLLTYPEHRDRVILIDSISKRFSACGARIGCLASHNAEVRQAALRFAQARLSPPSLGQLMATAALRLPPFYYDELIGEYLRRRDAVMEELGTIDGVLCERPRGAFYAMARLPVADADAFAAWMLTTFEHEGETTFVAPGNGFYATPGGGAREVRIAFVLDAERMRRAVRVLGLGLAAYPG